MLPPFNLQRYGCKAGGMDGFHLIEAVAKKRGYRIKGGEFDLEKAALTLLQDYRDGVLGRISLETPASREEMLKAAQTNPASKTQADSE